MFMQNKNKINTHPVIHRKSKIIIFKGFWSRFDVENNPSALFVFGDNNVHQGLGGQAIIRGLPNTIGIPTKKFPSNDLNSYYSDNDYVDNIRRIQNAVNEIINQAHKYKFVVLPEDGLGTGLAKLPTKAPKTFIYLKNAIMKLKNNI